MRPINIIPDPIDDIKNYPGNKEKFRNNQYKLVLLENDLIFRVSITNEEKNAISDYWFDQAVLDQITNLYRNSNLPDLKMTIQSKLGISFDWSTADVFVSAKIIRPVFAYYGQAKYQLMINKPNENKPFHIKQDDYEKNKNVILMGGFNQLFIPRFRHYKDLYNKNKDSREYSKILEFISYRTIPIKSFISI